MSGGISTCRGGQCKGGDSAGDAGEAETLFEHLHRGAIALSAEIRENQEIKTPCLKTLLDSGISHHGRWANGDVPESPLQFRRQDPGESCIQLCREYFGSPGRISLHNRCIQSGEIDCVGRVPLHAWEENNFEPHVRAMQLLQKLVESDAAADTVDILAGKRRAAVMPEIERIGRPAINHVIHLLDFDRWLMESPEFSLSRRGYLGGGSRIGEVIADKLGELNDIVECRHVLAIFEEHEQAAFRRELFGDEEAAGCKYFKVAEIEVRIEADVEIDAGLGMQGGRFALRHGMPINVDSKFFK